MNNTNLQDCHPEDGINKKIDGVSDSHEDGRPVVLVDEDECDPQNNSSQIKVNNRKVDFSTDDLGVLHHMFSIHTLGMGKSN